MDAERVIHPDSSSRSWLVWSSLLVALYLIICLLSWQRTLIGTEVWALYYAGQSFHEQLQAIRTDLVHPPLMYLVERFWLGTFGQTDRAAKTLALIINLPTFFLFTWLTQRITPHWRLASFLFLAIYLCVGSVPNLVRMYGLGLLLTVAVMVLWEKWCGAPRNSTLIAWSFVALLLIYTHLFGALLVLAFWAANWLCGPRRWAFTVAAAIPALAFLPWFLYVLPVYEVRGLAPNVAWVPKRFPVGVGYLQYGLLGVFPDGSLPVLAVFVLLAGLVHLLLFYSALKMVRRCWPPRSGLHTAVRWFWVGVLLAGLPLAMIILFSLIVIPSLASRFVLGVLPAYWLVVVLVWQESGRLGKIMLYGVALVWVVSVAVAALVRMDTHLPPREAALVLASEQRPSDLILCSTSCNEFYWELTHHFGRNGRIEVLGPGPLYWLTVPPQLFDLATLDPKTAARVWLFADSKTEADTLVDAFAQHGFVLQRKSSFKKYVLLLLVSPSAR